jgi:Secretion system C-terminal sorting domain
MKIFVVGFVALLSVYTIVQAETYRVGESEMYTIIQDAVNVAVDGDTVLVFPGIYQENLKIRNRNIVLISEFIFDNKTETVVSTIIDGSANDLPDTTSCISIYGTDSTPEIAGFTLTGGGGTKFTTSGGQLAREGGGIYSRNASPYIHHNRIIENHVPFPDGYTYTGGGGISTFYGSPLFENNYIENNSGDYAGGMVINFSAAIIRNNVIVGNNSQDSFGGGGGVMIYTPGSSVQFYNNNVLSNSCNGNGGDGLAVLSGSTLIGSNNIIFGNGQEIHTIGSGAANITYSVVEGGYFGLFNIDANPLLDLTNFTLLFDSPCIDAGDPNIMMNDVEDPDYPGYALSPAQGMLTSDIGAFGGPHMSLFAHPSQNSGTDEYCCPPDIPVEYTLVEAYPNPFNPITSLNFELDKTQIVKLTIYNILGKKITTLVDSELRAGIHQYHFDASKLSSGQYFYTLLIDEKVTNGILTYMK